MNAQTARGQLASPLGRPVLWGAVVFALAVGVAWSGGLGLPTWLPFAGLLAVAAAVATGVAWQGSGVFARPLVSVRTARPELALTFDDGPDPVHTLAILDLLEAHQHRGTFFIIGERARKHPQVLAEIARRGHGLANHSYRHGYLTNLSPVGALTEDLRRTTEIIEKASGVRPRWFRPPMGLLSPRVVKAARQARLDLVAWTASARDGVARTTGARALARLEPHLRPGAILVLHDASLGGAPPAALTFLPDLLDRLEARGLQSVTLDRLLED
jgi:peptidoglycan-N-acetylglucosamine deacetylase